MPDLDRLRTDELRRFGFLLVSDREASHMHHSSVRHRCDGCGLWVIQLYGKVDELRCRQCYRGPSPLPAEAAPALLRRLPLDQ